MGLTPPDSVNVMKEGRIGDTESRRLEGRWGRERGKAPKMKLLNIKAQPCLATLIFRTEKQIVELFTPK